MKDSDNFLQKAFYVGVGIAGLAVEKANDTLQELKKQAESLADTPDFALKIQQMADEMVSKGKMNTEEARRFVDEMVKQITNQPMMTTDKSEEDDSNRSPRKIEIILDDEDE